MKKCPICEHEYYEIIDEADMCLFCDEKRKESKGRN
jgi:hypothetical protein